MKNKKAIIIILIVVLVILSTYFLIKKQPEILPPMITEPIETPETKNIGYGWSVLEDSKLAIQEALLTANIDLKEKKAHTVILFSTVGYDYELIIQEILNHFGKNTQIYGGTSLSGVLTTSGLHVGEKRSLAIMAIANSKLNFGVGGVSLNDFNSAKNAGISAIKSAIQSAGKTINEKPDIILMTAAPGQEEEILLGIQQVVGKNIPVIGGSSADNDISGKWQQFANNNVFSNGISLVAVYTDLKIGWAYEAGYERTIKSGVITKAEGRIIYEIDNKPAAEVYNNWAENTISNELQTGGNILSKTNLYPLAKIIQNPLDSDNPYMLSIHPLSVNIPEKSLTMFANVDQGEKIMLLQGNWEILLNRAQITPNKAKNKENIVEDNIVFGLYTYCAGTLLAIPEEERAKMPFLINNELKKQPFIGTFTFGEQGFFKNIGPQHGNLINSMIIFSE